MALELISWFTERVWKRKNYVFLSVNLYNLNTQMTRRGYCTQHLETNSRSPMMVRPVLIVLAHKTAYENRKKMLFRRKCIIFTQKRAAII